MYVTQTKHHISSTSSCTGWLCFQEYCTIKINNSIARKYNAEFCMGEPNTGQQNITSWYIEKYCIFIGCQARYIRLSTGLESIL